MDMSSVIVPKSDQINADDLLAGSMTIKITEVKISGGQEQPVSIFFAGSTKAYRPCKSMSRVIVSAWGPDTSKYIGRSLTLFCDPKVKWGGMEVGGIRISHMSDIASPMTMALTVTRANRKPFTVKPINESAAPGAHSPSSSSTEPQEAADRLAKLKAAFAACDAQAERAFLKVAKLDAIEKLAQDDYDDAHDWLARRKQRQLEQPSQPTQHPQI